MGYFKFDPRIDMGHLITFVGMLLSVAAVYNSMDKRLTILEESSRVQASQLSANENRLNTTLNEMKADVRMLQNSVTDIRLSIAGGGMFIGGAARGNK